MRPIAMDAVRRPAAFVALMLAIAPLLASDCGSPGPFPQPGMASAGTVDALLGSVQGEGNPYLSDSFTENIGQLGEGAGALYHNGREASVAFGQGWVGFDLHGDGMDALYRVRLEGAPDVRPVGVDPTGHLSNFFIGNDPGAWRVGARSFRAVRYPDVADGIDLEYRFIDGALEWALDVRPGADPSAVRFAYEGVLGVHIGSEGRSLVVSTPLGDVREEGLLAYQPTSDGQAQVGCSFGLVNERTVQLQVASFDRDRPLVVDPVYDFCTYLGGSDIDYRTSGSVIDADGNVFIITRTLSDDFPTTPGVYCATHSGAEDTVVLKLKADGSSLVFSTYIGGSRMDGAAQIVLDASGNIYLSGMTESTDHPTTPGCFQGTNHGGSDAFAMVLGPDGDRLLFSTYIGGSSTDYGFGVGKDSEGCVYVAGSTKSDDLPTTTGSLDESYNGGFDAFVVKLSADGGDVIYGSYLGGTDDDEDDGMFVDAQGNAYVSGWTSSTNFPTTPAAYQRDNRGDIDNFLLKMAPDGSRLVYSTLLGGRAIEGWTQVTVDGDGNAYMVGDTRSEDLPTTPGAYDRSFNGVQDGYLAKFSPSGDALLLCTYYGGEQLESAYAIDIDEDGDIYIGGETLSYNLPTTENGDQYLGGGQDGYVAVINRSGSSLDYGSFIGGRYGDLVGNDGIICGPAGTIVVGATISDDLPTTEGAYCRTLKISALSQQDLFVMGLRTDRVVEKLPSAPQNLTAVIDMENDTIRLRWDPPLDEGGDLHVRGFNIYVSRDGSPLGLECAYDPWTLDHYHSPIVYGSAYRFGIGATNRLGQGELATVDLTPARIPGAPRNLSAVSDEGVVMLRWSEPADDGGASVQGYEVERGLGPDSFLPLASIGTALEHIDTGVVNGTTYVYRVRALNSEGHGGWSTMAFVRPVGPPPGPPMDLRAVAGDRRITLSWASPVSDGGRPLEGYVVYRGEDGGPMAMLATIGRSLQFVDSGDMVVNGRTYRYTVRAFNGIGAGPESGAVEAIPLGTPSAPVGLKAVFEEVAAELSWAAPEEDGGMPVLGYRVLRGSYSGFLTPLADVGLVLEYEDAGVRLSERCYYQVLAYNAIGDGTPCPEVEVWALRRSTPPLAFTVVSGEGCMELSWQPPVDSGGSPVLGYWIVKGERIDAMTFFANRPARELAYRDTEVKWGHTYYYFVMAVTDYGYGRASETLNGTPLYRATEPLGLVATPGNGHVALAWSPPENDGGVPVLGYTVLRGSSRNELVRIEALVEGLSYNDTKAENGLVYYYSVLAVTSLGEGGLSQVVWATPGLARTVPGRPSLLGARADDGKVALSWSYPESDGGSPITGFIIMRGVTASGLEPIAEVGAVREYIDETAEKGARYYYAVAAKNQIGQGEPSQAQQLEVVTVEEPGLSATQVGLAVLAAALIGHYGMRRGNRRAP